MKEGLRHKSKGSAIVENAFVLPFFLLVVFAVLTFGWMAFERASVDNQIEQIVNHLPDNYTTARPADVIRTAVLEDSLLDPSCLTISDAVVKQTSVAKVIDMDPIAKNLGGESSRKGATDLNVKATVTYKLKPLIPWVDELIAVDYVRTFNQALAIEREFEIS